MRTEAAEAHAAIVATLADLRRGLGQAADIRVWTQRHPWPAVGGAAAAGIVAGAMLRSRGDGAGDAQADHFAESKSAVPTARPSRCGTVFAALFDLAATSLQQLIIGMIQAHAVSHAAGEAVHEAADTDPAAAAAGP